MEPLVIVGIFSIALTHFCVAFQLGCCGANSPSDWVSSKYNNNEKQGIHIKITEPTHVWKLPASCCTRPEGSDECKDLKTGVAGPVDKYIDLVHPRVSKNYKVLYLLFDIIGESTLVWEVICVHSKTLSEQFYWILNIL